MTDNPTTLSVQDQTHCLVCDRPSRHVVCHRCLLEENERLRQVIRTAFEDLECNNEASAFLVLKHSGIVGYE